MSAAKFDILKMDNQLIADPYDTILLQLCNANHIRIIHIKITNKWKTHKGGDKNLKLRLN